MGIGVANCGGGGRTEAEKRRAGSIVMRAAMVIISSETKDSPAGAASFVPVVLFVPFAAAAVSAVAIAVFRPVAHD